MVILMMAGGFGIGQDDVAWRTENLRLSAALRQICESSKIRKNPESFLNGSDAVKHRISMMCHMFR